MSEDISNNQSEEFEVLPVVETLRSLTKDSKEELSNGKGADEEEAQVQV